MLLAVLGSWFLTHRRVCLSLLSCCHLFLVRPQAGASFTLIPGVWENSAEAEGFPSAFSLGSPQP